MFNLVSKFNPFVEQAKTIEELVKGINEKKKEQVLLGATVTGRTFTIASVIAQVNKPINDEYWREHINKHLEDDDYRSGSDKNGE